VSLVFHKILLNIEQNYQNVSTLSVARCQKDFQN